MNRNSWMDDFQKNLSELIAKSPAADIERNVKAMMTQTFSRLDLVTREEFELQTKLLQRALERIAVLEARFTEQGVAPGGAAGDIAQPSD
ncbi:MAG: accessory factor UbiK family protein [Candidimonas sp.]